MPGTLSMTAATNIATLVVLPHRRGVSTKTSDWILPIFMRSMTRSATCGHAVGPP
jgi:hypothetical protein